jgi:hypothetical protein
MARIMNMDRCMNPRPVSIVAEVDLERGLFVEIKGMAKNNLWLANEDDFEAYQVALATADTEKGDLLIHSTVPKMYDERLVEADFVLEAGAVGRGHYVTVGDEITIAKDLVVGAVEVGTELALDANGKLKVGTGLAKVVKVYNWNGQESIMIRFI